MNNHPESNTMRNIALAVLLIAVAAFTIPVLKALWPTLSSQGMVAAGNLLCDWCIDYMYHMCDVYSMQYGFLNILLFVVINPLISIFFFLAAISKDKVKSACLVTGVAIAVASAIFVAVPYFV